MCQEHILFAAQQATYTRRLAKYAVGLCRMASIKSVAAHLNLSWNTVKDMVKDYLERNYSKPDMSDLKVIGIDEFAVKKGHVYKTIVVNLETGQIVHVGDGKGADALDGFWKIARKEGMKIEAVASDLSAAYISAARTSLIPELVKVADTVDSHRDGILAYFYKPISTGSVEGINNKIKTLKRMAYGFRDDHYFTLRLLALHDFKFS